MDPKSVKSKDLCEFVCSWKCDRVRGEGDVVSDVEDDDDVVTDEGDSGVRASGGDDVRERAERDCDESGSGSGNESDGGAEISVGDKVFCNWYQDGDDDQWYSCTILHIDVESRTDHVKADEDGDEIEEMSWNWIKVV